MYEFSMIPFCSADLGRPRWLWLRFEPRRPVSPTDFDSCVLLPSLFDGLILGSLYDYEDMGGYRMRVYETEDLAISDLRTVIGDNTT